MKVFELMFAVLLPEMVTPLQAAIIVAVCPTVCNFILAATGRPAWR